MIHSNGQSETDAKSHIMYIEELARKETENIINSRKDQKIVLDREGADKARKLCRLLINTDRKDQRPRIMMKSIEIREGAHKRYPLSNRELDKTAKLSDKKLPTIV